MGTFLFHEIIFGPVSSRRLGISLGINLLPENSKLCNFNCVYCECGWTLENSFVKKQFQPREKVRLALIEKLSVMKNNGEKLDVITFAGNGEPTLHPDFAGVIDDTLLARNTYYPKARVAVLSNATRLNSDSVFNALLKVDDNILKLDSARTQTISLINCPNNDYNKEEVIANFMKFKGNFILQTMFVKGHFKDHDFDNTTEYEVESWIDIIRKTKPKMVMIYTIARDTPLKNIEKISLGKLNEIARKVELAGFKTSVSG
ncbi:MAG: radical SAM protein [Bacteroidetes bacterium GWF2_38_335]|nr:MAG: radical SAM protein [Bacteroidetes bacterium GWF2_38_335]OFY78304.1 MAG: radical SAM protein [Bacteroidetes bacterium RIFOXYA12_FULL_38_20]HBS87501.1 radical SAM protein [Bacteroidales bacterium]